MASASRVARSPSAFSTAIIMSLAIILTACRRIANCGRDMLKLGNSDRSGLSTSELSIAALEMELLWEFLQSSAASSSLTATPTGNPNTGRLVALQNASICARLAVSHAVAAFQFSEPGKESQAAKCVRALSILGSSIPIPIFTNASRYAGHAT